MPLWMLDLAIWLAAYLLGSIAFGIVVARAFALADPRSYGSHNPGATNVLRSGHKAAALLTLLGDAAKGWLAVFAVQHFAAHWSLSEVTLAGAALAVFVGHLWPVFFRFQGGKGVATALGVLLGLNPVLAGIALASFALVLLLTRWVSLASMLAALVAAAYQCFNAGATPVFYAVAAMAALLIYRHRANLQRLLVGQEPRLGGKNPRVSPR